MRSLYLFPIVLFFAGGIQAAVAGPQNLFTDPGFEHPRAPQGTFKVFGPGQTIGPWTVVGASGNVALTSTSFVGGGFIFEAHSGQGYVDLTGNCDCGAPSGVAQTVTTVPGATYQLTFWGSNAYIPGHGTTSQVQVYVGTTLIFTSLNTHGKGLDDQVWKKFSTSFVATDTASTISFINGDPNGDFMNGIDDVRLSEALN